MRRATRDGWGRLQGGLGDEEDGRPFADGWWSEIWDIHLHKQLYTYIHIHICVQSIYIYVYTLLLLGGGGDIHCCWIATGLLLVCYCRGLSWGHIL